MGRLVFLQVGVPKTLADRRAGPIRLAAGHGICAIVGGVEGARAVVAAEADAPERRVRWSAIGRLVAVDDSGTDVGPEFVVEVGAAADQTGGKAKPRVVGLVD